MERDKMIIKTIYNLVRDGWKSINTEQKICLAGIVIGMVMVASAFYSKYGLYMAVSGYTLAMFCSVGYGLFKYFPILTKSKQRIQQKTINDHIR